MDFQTAYLAGYFADKYDVSAEESVERANSRIRTTTEATFASTVLGYSTVVPTSTKVGLTRGQTQYALCPVWLMTTKYKGQDYIFAMNGQTGKFVGNLPVHMPAAISWWAGLTAAIGVIAYVLTLLF